jgi:hypothetical protein
MLLKLPENYENKIATFAGLSHEKYIEIKTYMLKKLALFLVLVGFISCNNELEINAPFKDVTVVYGMLNAGEDTNWVRIHRAYLGNEGIAGGNQEPDSIYYSNLQVTMEVLDDNDNIVNTYPLVRDNDSRQLDSGFFTTSAYRLYRFDELIVEDNTYRIIIDKPDGEGERVSATTPIVGEFDITSPRGIQKITFGRNGQDFDWEPAVNARIYQAFLRFHYVEYNRNNKNDSTLKSIDYVLPTKLGTTINGTGSDISVNISYDTYFRFLENTIGINTSVNRFFRGMDIFVVAGADDLATYINVSQPAQGIVQDQPFYTNVTNGAGIFSSRANSEKTAMEFSNASLDSLFSGIFTCELRFGKQIGLDTCYCFTPGRWECE